LRRKTPFSAYRWGIYILFTGHFIIISCGVLSGNNEIVTDATRMLVERISGIMTIYKVNAPNLEYVKITVGNECPKIYSDHALSVKKGWMMIIQINILNNNTIRGSRNELQ
jgi:uncharacterized protein (UPF0212 family)